MRTGCRKKHRRDFDILWPSATHSRHICQAIAMLASPCRNMPCAAAAGLGVQRNRIFAPILIARCPSRNCAKQRFSPYKFASIFDVAWLTARFGPRLGACSASGRKGKREESGWRQGANRLTVVGDAPFAAQRGACDAANHPGPRFSRLRTDSEQNLSLSCQWPSSEPGPARNQPWPAAASPCQCRRAGKCC